MADYPILAPTLAALSATKNDPQGTEDASKLDDSIRQTRNWIYDYLSQYFDANGLKSGAFANGGSLPTAYIRGTDPLTSAARELAQGTIRTADIADKQVTAAKVADSTLSSQQIVAQGIKTESLADQAVTSAKLAEGSVEAKHMKVAAFSGDKLTDASIETEKLADECVTNDKILKRSIDGDRIVTAKAGQILVGGVTVNGETDCLGVVTLSGAASIDSTGKLVLNAGQSVAMARVAEMTTKATNAGTPSVKWTSRGVSPCPPWVVVYDTGKLVTIDGKHIKFNQDGVYWIQASAPAFRANGHRIRMTVMPDPDLASTDQFKTVVYAGSTEYAADAGYVSSRSVASAVITIKNTTETAFAYLFIEHFISNYNQNGLGLAGSDSVNDQLPELFAIVDVLRLQSFPRKTE